MKKKIIILIVILAVLGGGFFLLQKQNASKQAMNNVILVRLAEAKPEGIKTVVNADGSILADDFRGIKARLSGLFEGVYVEEVYVDEGDFVEAGDRILKLDDEQLKESLSKAELNLEEANKNYQSLLATYKQQDRLNELKLEEAQRDLEITITTLKKEEISLQNQLDRAEDKLTDTQEELESAEKKYQENQYLYKNNAVSRKVLQDSEEAYQKAYRNHEQAKAELNTLVEDTKPNSLKLAQLNVDNSRSKLELVRATIAKEKVTDNDLELSKLKVTRVRKEIEGINKDLDRIIIQAPISGTITVLEARVGDKITEGAKIGEMADLNNLIAEVMVDEINVNQIQLKQEVLVTSDAFDVDVVGEIRYIAPVGTEVGNINKYKTEITIADTNRVLKPGMFVTAEIITASKTGVITVPSLAIQGEEEKYIFVEKEGKAEKRPVEVGLKSLSKVEISGVTEGEKVVIGPFSVLKNLKPGANIADADAGNEANEATK